MHVRIKIDVFPGEDSETREKFWQSFNELSERDVNPYEAEESLRNNFAQKLESHLNGESESYPQKLIGRAFGTFRPRISVRLVDIRYGSLDLLLNILGVDQKMIAEGFWEMLEFYCPSALNETLGTNVPVDVTVYKPRSNVDLLKKDTRMAILQTSLLVPVLLALLVGWYGFDAMKERLRAVDEERKNLREEHSKILIAVMSQNDKLSSVVLGRVGDVKAFDEFQQTLLKQMISSQQQVKSEQGLKPSEAK